MMKKQYFGYKLCLSFMLLSQSTWPCSSLSLFFHSTDILSAVFIAVCFTCNVEIYTIHTTFRVSCVLRTLWTHCAERVHKAFFYNFPLQISRICYFWASKTLPLYLHLLSISCVAFCSFIRHSYFSTLLLLLWLSDQVPKSSCSKITSGMYFIEVSSKQDCKWYVISLTLNKVNVQYKQ